jgi:hypothetical protein
MTIIKKTVQEIGCGTGLDESALAAFSQWKFRPARQGGHPVETKVVVVIPFRCSADALAARMILELPRVRAVRC